MNILRTIFISPSEPRLRAGWRLLLQILIALPIGFAVDTAAKLIFPLGYGGMLQNQIINLLIITLSVYLARRWFDKRTFVSLGFRLDKRIWADLLAGIFITFILMGCIYLVEYEMGWLTFEGFAWDTEPVSRVTLNLLGVFGLFLLVSWNEELLSRGYQLQNLADGLNLTWGVIISSAVFGLLHLGNPNATWISAAGIFFAGLFLAYAYLRTGQLWLSIGLHLGWNFFEGTIFGFPVSGIDIYRLTKITVHGPELWTGGAFGPEAGLIVLPALALGTLLIYVWSKKSGSYENE
jgi:membrane protease YdiL (CAAX protease family)